MEEFELKYNQGLKELSKELDTYIQNEWRAYDYLLSGERTGMTIYEEDKSIDVYFGDSNTRDRRCLSIQYGEIENDLIIKDISFLKNNKIYSDEVKTLVGNRIKGRTNDELIRCKIESLEKRYEDKLYKIKEYEECVKFEKEQSENLKSEINKLKNGWLEEGRKTKGVPLD